MKSRVNKQGNCYMKLRVAQNLEKLYSNKNIILTNENCRCEPIVYEIINEN